jgi:DNA-binding response OmpR family regulator
MSNLTKYKVLVVDDEPIVRKMHESMLSENFQVVSLASGKEALDYLNRNTADVVLLDLGLPDLDGFSVCQCLKQEGRLDTTSVIFVSANSDLETRIQAFNSGGDDFIAKPLNRDDLLAKIQLLRHRKQKQKLIEKQLSQANQAARKAIVTSNELERVMQFIEQSFTISSHGDLIDGLFHLLRILNLSAVLVTDINGKAEFFSSEGEIKPIEKELLELLKSKGSIYDFNQRTQINYPHISVLFKNMPIADSDHYQRLKELLPAIGGCLNSRLAEIEHQQNIISQAQDLIYSFNVIQVTMQTLTHSLGNNQQKAADRLHKMVYELQVFIQRLGLEDDQEERVIKYVDDAVEESLSLLDAGKTIFRSFQEILTSLKDTLEEQNKMIARVTQESKVIKTIATDLDLGSF